MFTGLIEDIGTVQKITPRATGRRLVVKCSIDLGEVAIGDSVAVDGFCLTVVEKGRDEFAVDVGQETLAVTTVGDLKIGRRVNLERAMRLGDRLGGHLVAGHVDGVGSVQRIERSPDFIIIHIRAPKSVSRYMIEKGSVCVSGVSLTVNSVSGDVFSVGVIPHTAANTNIHELKTGDKVNLESDMIGKYVEKFFLASQGKESGAITKEFLARHGFGD